MKTILILFFLEWKKSEIFAQNFSDVTIMRIDKDIVSSIWCKTKNRMNGNGRRKTNEKEGMKRIHLRKQFQTSLYKHHLGRK